MHVAGIAIVVAVVLSAPAAAAPPHILMILIDDFGWTNSGWHAAAANASAPSYTPNMDALLRTGIELDRAYAFELCSPSRSALQSGRNPIHVNLENLPIGAWNPNDRVGGFAGVPPAMRGMADVLATAGYSNHMAGKWDAGMALRAQTPAAHSYNSSLLYFSHCVDYWTATPSNGCPANSSSSGVGGGGSNSSSSGVGGGGGSSDELIAVVDLWEDEGPSTRNGSSACGGAAQPVRHCDCTSCGACKDPADMVHGNRLVLGPFKGVDDDSRYIDQLFTERVLSVIQNASNQQSDGHTVPHFIFWAPHAAHTPLQPPQHWIQHVDDVTAKAGAVPIDRDERRAYLALLASVDYDIGRVVRAAQDGGLWDNMLVVLASDNGGPVYLNGTSGANNHPLRGGKASNWEGGIRVNAFASGGALPLSVQGTRLKSLVTLWDLFATFGAAAGLEPSAYEVDDSAAQQQLPPVDSISMWEHWLNPATVLPPRTELAIGTAPRGNSTIVQGLIQQRGHNLFKALCGSIAQSGWTGQIFSNASTDSIRGDAVHECTISANDTSAGN